VKSEAIGDTNRRPLIESLLISNGWFLHNTEWGTVGGIDIKKLLSC
jgi:hypothetical protein